MKYTQFDNDNMFFYTIKDYEIEGKLLHQFRSQMAQEAQVMYTCFTEVVQMSIEDFDIYQFLTKTIITLYYRAKDGSIHTIHKIRLER